MRTAHPIAVSLLAFCVTWFASISHAASTEVGGSVHVVGEAEVRVQPDEARLRFAVVHERELLVNARTANQQTMAELIRSAEQHGFARRDLASTPSMVFPGRWLCSACTEEQKKTGYTARTEATFTLRDLGRLNQYIESISSKTAVQLLDVEYHSSELRKHRDAARAQAIRAAREKAIALAAELGQTIGTATSVNEDQSLHAGFTAWSHWGYTCCGYYSSGWSRGSYGQGMQNVLVESSTHATSDAGSVAPGVIPVRARIQAVFELHRAP
jgi:uncharacterized protein